MTTARSILDTYLHMRDVDQVAAVPVTDAFWNDLAQGRRPELDVGRLLTAFTFDAPWSTWERHPGGDELVMLLSGEATMVLDEAGTERTVRLQNPGDYLLVPRGTWHTARTDVATTMLFLTSGAGTEHRPAAE